MRAPASLLVAWLARGLLGCADGGPAPSPGISAPPVSSASASSSAPAVAEASGASAVAPAGSLSAEAPRPASPEPPDVPGAEDRCEDLVDARGATIRETDVARRAPGRGPRPGQIRGVDASSRAPWRAIRDQGFAFAFVQAGFGITQNAAFRDNWDAARRCGLPRGAYHFVNADRDGATQARAFLETRGPDRGDLPPSIDLEKPPGCADDCCGKPCSQWTAVVRDWIRVVSADEGRRPMIYAVEPFWNQCLCGTRAFADHPLWLPAWPKFDFPDPVRFGGWRRWDFYQYDGNVKVGDGVIDLNLFRGSRAELDDFLRASAPSAPSPR